MIYKPLGTTGLKVSAFGLGCGNFGGVGSVPECFGKGETEQEAFVIMDRALELGINFFDTANTYGGGRSETFIGNWLSSRGSQVRHQLLLSSKVGTAVGPGPNGRGLSRRHILGQIEESLRRLRTDYLDMYLIHQPDRTTPIEETLQVLDDLVHEGKVRYLGACNMPAWLMVKALWTSDKQNLHCFGWVQNSYSLLHRDDEREMLPLCEDQGLGYTPFSPLEGGWLTGKYQRGAEFPAGSRMSLRPEPYRGLLTERVFQALEAFRVYAVQRETDRTSLALAWVASHPLVTAPVVGPRRPEQLEPVGRALEMRMSEEERRTIAKMFQDVS